jgi:L,D-transpeptidase YcbB
LLADSIRFVVLNPYWNVPPDLVRDRYAPRVLAQGKPYMTSRGFEALTDWGDTPRVVAYEEVDWKAVAAGKTELPFRQKPGPGNGMGKIKFMFPNRYGVYLHDTPSVELFQKPVRTFSAGCVRIQKPWALAAWLFDGKVPGPTPEVEKIVQLPKPVPVYLTYLTAVPHATGFRFLDDIYNWDKGAPATVPATASS